MGGHRVRRRRRPRGSCGERGGRRRLRGRGTMIAEAVRVSPEWLLLREPADAAARSAELAQRLGRHLASAGRLVIHDLGGGSGAMGRWLAPRLPVPQHWVVHDWDADLLRLAAADVPGPVTVEGRRSDITRLTRGELAGASLVTASALLDLLTADELARMLVACAGCPMLLALSVVGRVTLTPEEPLDALMGAAFNSHQRRGRLRAGARAGRQGPRLPGAAPGAVGRRRARRRRRPRRRAGAAVTWRRVSLAVAAATLAVLVWRLGTGPFLDGLRAVNGWGLAAASGLAVVTTMCCAWRWRVVARGLGVDLPLDTAVAAYYRSLFLNVTLPGGVVGDVHPGSATAVTRATSAAGCVASRWSARPGRSSRSSSPSRYSSSCRRRCTRSCRSSRSLSSQRRPASCWRHACGPPSADPGGHGCAGPRPATCATRCSPGGRGRPSPSRRRSGLRATQPRS